VQAVILRAPTVCGPSWSSAPAPARRRSPIRSTRRRPRGTATGRSRLMTSDRPARTDQLSPPRRGSGPQLTTAGQPGKLSCRYRVTPGHRQRRDRDRRRARGPGRRRRPAHGLGEPPGSSRALTSTSSLPAARSRAWRSWLPSMTWRAPAPRSSGGRPMPRDRLAVARVHARRTDHRPSP